MSNFEDLYELNFEDEKLFVDANKVKILHAMANFQQSQNKVIKVTDKKFFEEMKTLNENYYNIQTSFDEESIELVSMYCSQQSFYDPEYYNIYLEEKTYFQFLNSFNDLIPILEQPYQRFNDFFKEKIGQMNNINVLKNVDFVSDIFYPYNDNLICVGEFPLSCVMGFSCKNIDIFIHSSNDDDIYQKIIKHVSLTYDISIKSDHFSFSYEDYIIKLFSEKYNCAAELLFLVSIDCYCILIDLKSTMFYTTKRGYYSLKYRVNTVNYEKMDENYEMNLVNSIGYGFNIFIPEHIILPYDLSQFNVTDFSCKCKGLMLLLKYYYCNEKFSFSIDKNTFKINGYEWLFNSIKSIPKIKIEELSCDVKKYSKKEFLELIDADNFFKENEFPMDEMSGHPFETFDDLINHEFIFDLMDEFNCKISGNAILNFLLKKKIFSSSLKLQGTNAYEMTIKKFYMQNSLKKLGLNERIIINHIDSLEYSPNYSDDGHDDEIDFYIKNICDYLSPRFSNLDHLEKSLCLIFNVDSFSKYSKEEIMSNFPWLEDECVMDILNLSNVYYKLLDIKKLCLDAENVLKQIPNLYVIRGFNQSNDYISRYERDLTDNSNSDINDELYITKEGIFCSDRMIQLIKNKTNIDYKIPGFRYDFSDDEKIPEHSYEKNFPDYLPKEHLKFNSRFYLLLNFCHNAKIHSKDMEDYTLKLFETDHIKTYEELLEIKNKIHEKYEKLMELMSEYDDDFLRVREIKQAFLETVVKTRFTLDVSSYLNTFIKNFNLSSLDCEIINLLIKMNIFYTENGKFEIYCNIIRMKQETRKKLFSIYKKHFLVGNSRKDKILVRNFKFCTEYNFPFFYSEHIKTCQDVYEFELISKIFTKMDIGFEQKLSHAMTEFIFGNQFLSNRTIEVIKSLKEKLRSVKMATEHMELIDLVISKKSCLYKRILLKIEETDIGIIVQKIMDLIFDSTKRSTSKHVFELKQGICDLSSDSSDDEMSLKLRSKSNNRSKFVNKPRSNSDDSSEKIIVCFEEEYDGNGRKSKRFFSDDEDDL